MTPVSAVADGHQRILVIDHQPIMREGIVAVLSSIMLNTVFENADGFENGLNHLERCPVDMVICDFQVGGESVISFLHSLKRTGSATRCLIVCSLEESQVGYQCVRAGAAGFVEKSSRIADLVVAAQNVLEGRVHLSHRLSKAFQLPLPTEEKGVSGHSLLSPREFEVFSLIGWGNTVSVIADKPGISVKTVERHRENIKNKLNLASAPALVASAARWLDAPNRDSS